MGLLLRDVNSSRRTDNGDAIPIRNRVERRPPAVRPSLRYLGGDDCEAAAHLRDAVMWLPVPPEFGKRSAARQHKQLVYHEQPGRRGRRREFPSWRKRQWICH